MRTMIVFSLAALAFLAASAGAAANTSNCPRGGKTVIANKHARLWEIRPKSEISRYYGCAHRVGKVIRLDPPRGQLIADRNTTKLVGTTLAYEAMSFELRPYRIIVRSLRTGRAVHSATSNAQRTSMGHTGPALNLLLKRNGTVAWTTNADCICEGSEGDPPPTYEVHKIGNDHRRVVLDDGAGIDPNSLRFTTRRTAVSWMKDGESRTGPLGG